MAHRLAFVAGSAQGRRGYCPWLCRWPIGLHSWPAAAGSRWRRCVRMPCARCISTTRPSV
jgi:hypothetical protein